MKVFRPSILLVLALQLNVAFSQQKKGGPLAVTIQPYVDRSELAGAVMLVADKDKVLAIETAGWADIAENQPMKADSMFWIASQSKPMTCAAFMILVDEGKVALDDPVEKYLPEFKAQMVIASKSDDEITLKKPKRPITVRDVMSHSSGMPFKSALEEPTMDLYALSARVRSYAMTPLDNEPGTHYRYSNAGINTAARIIEVVSGLPYEDFMAERLFKPLGMTDTTFCPTEEQAARIANSYKPGPQKKGLEATVVSQLHYPLTDRTKRFPMPAGGLFSTASDVAKFYQLIANEGTSGGKTILSKEAVKALTTKQTPDNLKNGYGFGFTVSPDNVGHGGAYSTLTTLEKKSGLILVWLVQHAGFPGKGGEAKDTFRKAATEKFATK